LFRKIKKTTFIIGQTKKNHLFEEIVNLLSSRRPKELEVVSKVIKALFKSGLAYSFLK